MALLQAVFIPSHRALASFDRLLDRDMSARDVVITFNIEITHGSTNVVEPAQLSALLSKLPCVQEVSSIDLDEIYIPVYVVPTTLSNPSSLKCLDHLGCDQWPSSTWASELAIFTELVELNLEIMGADEEAAPHTPAGAPMSRLRRLSLRGDGMSTWAAPPLHIWAPNLVALTLEDIQPFAWFAPILGTAPVDLRKLVVVCEDPDVEPQNVQSTAAGALDGVLPRFSSLEHLELCRGSFTPERLVPYIRTLSTLRVLAFNERAPVSDNLLRSLVNESLASPGLQHLILDHVKVQRGPTVASRGGRLPSRSHEGRRGMWAGWQAPVWPRGGSEAAMWDVVDALQAQGVVVSGTALEVRGWEDEYRAERRVVQLARSDLVHDYTLARRYLGDDVVDAHLARLETDRAS